MRRIVVVFIGLASLAGASWLFHALGAGDASTKKPTNSLGMTFALVPAGSFAMGSPETEVARGKDELQHDVKLTKPFFIAIHEVTQGQYAKVMGSGSSFFSAQGGGKQRVAGKSTTDFPVDSVSWDQAVDFCKKLGALPDEKASGRTYRLPTEAEWEYACRGGTSTVFHYGNIMEGSKANFCGLNHAAYGTDTAGPFMRRTAQVGEYKANAYGLYDMHGNVQEWCQDWYDADYYSKSPKEDPTGPEAGSERVLRGGGWPHAGKSLRSAFRNKLAPDETNYSAGFRAVLETK